MKYCNQCGERLNDDQAFCTNCGAPVAAVKQKSQYRDEPVYQDDQVYDIPAPAPKNKKALTIGLIVGGSILLIGLVFLILWLTGVFNKKDGADESTDNEFGTRISDTVVEKMDPSYEKLIAVEDNFLFDTFSKIKTCLTVLRKACVDVDVTADATKAYTSSGFDVADLVNRAKIQVHADGRTGYDLGADLTISGNPIVDLRLFDLDKNKVKFYCSTDPDYMYVAALDDMIPNLVSQNSGIPVKELLELLYSGKLPSMIESDYKDLSIAVTGLIKKENTTVDPETTVNMGDLGYMTCEKYIVTPTADDFEVFLGKILDIYEKNDGFISTLVTYSGMSKQDIKETRQHIREYAESIYNDGKGIKLEVAVQDGKIIKQTVLYSEEPQVTYISCHTDAGYYANLQTPVLWFTRDDRSGRTNINGYIAGYNFYADFDLNQKSEIGTYAGSFRISDRHYGTIVSVDAQTNGNGMLHSVTINTDAIDLDSTFSRLVLLLNVKPGTGVQKPNTRYEEDITKYDRDRLEQLMYRLIGPLQNNLNFLY